MRKRQYHFKSPFCELLELEEKFNPKCRILAVEYRIRRIENGCLITNDYVLGCEYLRKKLMEKVGGNVAEKYVFPCIPYYYNQKLNDEIIEPCPVRKIAKLKKTLEDNNHNGTNIVYTYCYHEKSGDEIIEKRIQTETFKLSEPFEIKTRLNECNIAYIDCFLSFNEPDKINKNS